MRDPSIVIVVTVTGTSGEAGYGGTAAGPAFVKVMSTALRRQGVVRDVPEEIEEIELAAKEKEKKAGGKEKNQDMDDVAVAALDPPTAEEMQHGMEAADSNV